MSEAKENKLWVTKKEGKIWILTGFLNALVVYIFLFLLFISGRGGPSFYNYLLFVVSLSSAVIPSVVLGIKKGLKAGLLNFGWTIAWFFILLVAISAIFFIFTGGIRYD